MFFLLLCFLSIWYVIVRCLCLHLSFTVPHYIHSCYGCCCCRFPIAPNNNDIVTGYPQHERYSLLRQPIRDTRFHFHIEMRICLFDHLHPHGVATVLYKWHTYFYLIVRSPFMRQCFFRAKLQIKPEPIGHCGSQHVTSVEGLTRMAYSSAVINRRSGGRSLSERDWIVCRFVRPSPSSSSHQQWLTNDWEFPILCSECQSLIAWADWVPGHFYVPLL